MAFLGGSHSFVVNSSSCFSSAMSASVYAEFQGHAFKNEHHYGEYERFRVSVKISMPKTYRACADLHPMPQ